MTVVQTCTLPIDELIEKLKSTDIPILIARYELELETITEELSKLGIEPFNIRSEIEEINRDRDKRADRGYKAYR